jgi:hypothetical protein
MSLSARFKPCQYDSTRARLRSIVAGSANGIEETGMQTSLVPWALLLRLAYGPAPLSSYRIEFALAATARFGICARAGCETFK